MMGIVIVVLLFVILFFVLTHRFTATFETTDEHSTKVQTKTTFLSTKEIPRVKTDEGKVSEMVREMPLDEKIGQLIIGGISGTTLTEETMDLIQTYKLGGFILFSDNLQNPHQSVSLLNEVKDANEASAIPLLLSVDQEGGNVTRLPGLHRLVTNKEIGNVNEKKFALKNGELLGRQLKTFGLHVNFAPVLDVNNNPRNPVIGERSFGDDPKLVSDLGVQVMHGLQNEKVIPVVKHFPGHGDTDIDSHHELPVIDKSLEELENVEFVPFQYAIEEGADVIMTAHLLLPQIESKFPATMSEKVITKILREQLHFEGVVVTDDLSMGAIINDYQIDNH